MTEAAPDTLAEILAGRYIDPETGGRFACPVAHVTIAATLDGAEPELVAQARLGGRPAVVADETTWEVMGRRVAQALGTDLTLVLKQPHADLSFVEQIRRGTERAHSVIAVGSGTISDLCKLAAHKDHRRYAIFATAPSMNGYVTGTASMTARGLKVSLPAHPPAAAFFDLKVLARAPARMIRAGIGDCLARSTAQVDWLLSHLLLGTPYTDTPFAMQADDEAALHETVEEAIRGEPVGIELLVRTLLLSGFGMALVGSSHPASMGEHLISHYIDTLAEPHPGSLHGEQVGVASWTMARLQAQVIGSREPPVFLPTTLDEEELRQRHGLAAEDCVKALKRKALDGAAVERLNSHLATDWPRIRSRLRAAMLPVSRLERVLGRGGLPMSGESLGLTAEFYREAVRHAREARDRFGMLDLAADCGILEAFVADES
jgi:glycerol-1-phosphate dehydrogenase [NAD(P)+]